MGTGGTSEIEQVAVGNEVITHRGRKRPVVAVNRRAFTGEFYRIRCYGTPDVEATDEHPFLVGVRPKRWVGRPLEEREREIRYIWKAASDVTKDDWLVEPVVSEISDVDTYSVRREVGRSRIETVQVSVTPNLLRLVGYWLAEGWVNGRSVRFAFDDREYEYHADVIALMRETFGVENSYQPSQMLREDHGYLLCFNSVAATTFFTQFGHGARHKFVPDWVLTLPFAKQAELLKGYWRGDGSGDGTGSYRASTVSRQLAEGVRAICLRLGIVPSFHWSDRPPVRHPRYPRRSGRTINASRSFWLVASGGSAQVLAEILGETATVSGKRWMFIANGYAHHKVRSNESFPVADLPVFNLQVEDDESYVAEGVAVHNCSLIADSVASLPIELRNGPDRQSSKLLPSSPLLTKPYAEISRRDWWVGFIWALALRGNFFGRIIERDKNSLPLQIKPIHNDAVQVFRDRETGVIVYRYYGEYVPLSDVVHVRYQTTPGNILGLNPIQLLALTFGNAVAKERFVESFYLNSANPMGVIQIPNYVDRVEIRKMMRAWVSAHQGLNKANLPAILTEGAEFKPITISPSDSQLIEALQFSDAQICGRIFRVPPHMIGIPERVSGVRGIEQAERSFFANTLVGYLDIAMEAFSEYHRPGQFVHFDVTKRERGSTLERAQAGALGMNSGIFVADEIRDWFDLPPLPGGDGQKSFMPINTQLLETAILTLKQAEKHPEALLPAPAAPSTVSGAPPRNTKALTKPGSKPPRKNAPAVTPHRAENGNGHMSLERAWHVVESALEQSRRMQYAADLASRLGSEED